MCKRIFILATALCLAVSTAGCGNTKNAEPESENTQSVEQGDDLSIVKHEIESDEKYYTITFTIKNETDDKIRYAYIGYRVLGENDTIKDDFDSWNQSSMETDLDKNQSAEQTNMFSVADNIEKIEVDCYAYYDKDNELVEKPFIEKYIVEIPIKESSQVYESYTATTSLTKNDLEKTSKGYSYNGLDLLSDDCDWINNKLNTSGKVEPGALYRKMAYLLEGFSAHLNDYKDYAELLIGDVPDTRDEFEKYANNASAFITRQDEIKNIMKKMESLSCVTGDFDYEYGSFGKYSFEVDNLSECAEEMQISETMLGYIFAFLNEYAATTTFDGNSCTFSYEGFKTSAVKEMSADDFIAISEGETKNILDEMKLDYGEGGFEYFYYDASVDESKDGVIKTNREIYIGTSKETVIKTYGDTPEKEILFDGDHIYNSFIEAGQPDTAAMMKKQCVSYLAYNYADEANISFYLDKNDCVTWIVYGLFVYDDVNTVSLGNSNALLQAKNYLKLTAFSLSGLMEQLEYEGYTEEEAQYAVDNCDADWEEQAAKKAKQYMQSSNFSKDKLIEQLEYEGFTRSQAEYGASQIGY